MYHKNTTAQSELVNRVLGDTLLAFSNCSKDDWDMWLSYTVFAINNVESTGMLGGSLSPFFIYWGQTTILQPSLPNLRSEGESQSAYRVCMKALEQEVQALLHTAQQECKTVLDCSRVDTTFQVGSQVLFWTAELLDTAEIGKPQPRWGVPFW